MLIQLTVYSAITATYLYLNQHLTSLQAQLAYNNFADKRCMCCIHNAADVLSNLIFVIAPFWFGTELWLGLSLIAVGFGSAFYHFDPAIDTLYADRLPMAITFGIILYRTIGITWLAFVPVLSVELWARTGHLIPYAVIQYVPMIIYLQYDCGMRTVCLYYVLAKICETYDREIYVVTGKIVSGHTLKHLIAGLAIGVMDPKMC